MSWCGDQKDALVDNASGGSDANQGPSPSSSLNNPGLSVHDEQATTTLLYTDDPHVNDSDRQERERALEQKIAVQAARLEAQQEQIDALLAHAGLHSKKDARVSVPTSATKKMFEIAQPPQAPSSEQPTWKDKVARTMLVDHDHLAHGLLVAAILGALFLFFAIRIFVDSYEARKSPPLSTENAIALGKVRFPTVALCSEWFISPGMNNTWFDDVEAGHYPDWSDLTEPEPYEIESRFVDASKYERNGTCLSFLSEENVVHSTYDALRISFAFSPDYNELCKDGSFSYSYSYDDGSDRYYNDSSVGCSSYYKWASYVGAEFEVILGETPNADYGTTQSVYVPYNDMESVVSITPSQEIKLDGEVLDSYSTTVSSVDMLRFNKIYPDGTHFVIIWFEYPSADYIIFREIDPVNFFNMYASVVALWGTIVGMWAKFIKKMKGEDPDAPSAPLKKSVAEKLFEWLRHKSALWLWAKKAKSSGVGADGDVRPESASQI